MIWLTILVIIVALFVGSIVFGAPYVPSHQRAVRRLFARLPVTKQDVVVDIGSGDGRILRAAAMRGARAVGFEINPILILITWLLNRGIKGITVRWANFWVTALPAETTIVYAFSVNRDRRRLTRKLQREAERLNRSLLLVCYGSPLVDVVPTHTIDAFSIYSFHPLHSPKAQV